jgi:hypothetical protein
MSTQYAEELEDNQVGWSSSSEMSRKHMWWGIMSNLEATKRRRKALFWYPVYFVFIGIECDEMKSVFRQSCWFSRKTVIRECSSTVLSWS